MMDSIDDGSRGICFIEISIDICQTLCFEIVTLLSFEKDAREGKRRETRKACTTMYQQQQQQQQQQQLSRV